MSQEIVRFSATDGVTLDGFIYKCDKPTKKVLIQVHGMTSNCFKYRNMEIADSFAKIEVDSLIFNNRGSEVAKLIKPGEGAVRLAGTAYEEISECYYDIVGAINFALSRGYDEIYLQGHSLGATKVVYSYNKMIKEDVELSKHVKAIILLSLVDLPMVIKYYGNDFIPFAKERVEKGQGEYLMQTEAFPYRLSAKVFLRYSVNCEDIDFAKFGHDEDNFEVLNSFNIPLFFRWGNVGEILSLPAEKQVEFVKKKINNENLNVGFIDGADHSYHGKEAKLTEEMTTFIQNIN